MNDYKLVEFKDYCKMCKHYGEDETDEPCNECLTHGANIDTHKPINFEES